MKITYKLYSVDYPNGKLLAEVTDLSQAFVLESYYLKIYNNEKFRVTSKHKYKKEQHFIGQY